MYVRKRVLAGIIFCGFASSFVLYATYSGKNDIGLLTPSTAQIARSGTAQERKPECHKRRAVRSPQPLPAIGLVSFPSSGNCWTRHLIRQMTGIETSTVHCRNRSSSRCITNGTIVIKTHSRWDLKLFDKVVLLIRSPLDAFMAFFNFKKGGFKANVSNDSLLSAKEYFNRSMKWYKELVMTYVAQPRIPVHILQYRRLQSNLPAELRMLAKFLNVTVSNEEIQCTLQHQEGAVHRTTSPEKRLEQLHAVFNDDDIARIRKLQIDVESIIKKWRNETVDLSSSLL